MVNIGIDATAAVPPNPDCMIEASTLDVLVILMQCSSCSAEMEFEDTVCEEDFGNIEMTFQIH